MKNKCLIDSWDKINPGESAHGRILDNILSRKRSANFYEQRNGNQTGKTYNRKRLVPAAACLLMVMFVTAFWGNNAGWFDGKIYTAESDGGTLKFYKTASPGSGSLDFGVDVTSRELTADENAMLFGDLGVASHGIFDAQNKQLLHVEGRNGNTKIILAAHGVPVTDAVIETNRKTSEINGVRVSAGYFITRANSRGERNIIFLAQFELNGKQIYVECGGDLNMSEKWETEISYTLDALTKINAFDFASITE